MENRVCDECNSNAANIHLTQIVQNEVSVLHLCEECAKKKGISIVIESEKLDLPRKKKEKKAAHKSPAKKDEEKIVCPSCRTTFEEFRESGRLGCSGCYAAFDREIESLLVQLHGDSRHRGKSYGAHAAVPQNSTDIASLKIELDNAIRSEKFELAAVIRDKIHSVSPRQSSAKGL